MRTLLTLILTLTLVVAAASAQPQYGDLVYNAPPITGYFNPAQPGAIVTLATARPGYFHAGVLMAPDNRNLVAGEGTTTTMPWTGDLIMLDTGGNKTPIATAIPGAKTFHLDHDDKWICAYANWPLPSKNYLYSIEHSTGTVVTHWTVPNVGMNGINASAIDRDPGSSLPYVIACGGTYASPHVLRADRQGTIVTLVPGSSASTYASIELHPRSGDYILGGFASGGVTRMTKAGAITIVAPNVSVNALKVTQDDFAWCAVQDPLGRPAALKVDLSTNVVVTMVPTGLLSASLPLGIEVYGSRPLVCRQLPASPRTVTVDVQSRHPQAAGQSYRLAASFARRPGLKFSNGEWLDLDVTGPLFYLSALDLAPSIFTNFHGTLNASGNATATVAIPSAVPLTNTIAIFVAGVITNNGKVVEVTNSHWFLL